jgi:putative membrane protein
MGGRASARRTRRGIRLTAATALLGALMAAGSAFGQPMPAQDFVNGAAQSDAFEIASGELVLTQSTDANVRRFAEQMIADHRKTSADLTAAAQASHLAPPPPGLSGDQQRSLSGLQSQKGQDLDRSFMTAQVNAHAAALATQQGYLAEGSDPNLRKVAQAAVPLIKGHLQMAKRLRVAMGSD